jgi:hypothetical protein
MTKIDGRTKAGAGPTRRQTLAGLGVGAGLAAALLRQVGFMRFPQPGDVVLKFTFHLCRSLLQLHSFPSPHAD